MRLGWTVAAKTAISRISQTRPYKEKTVIDLLSALLIVVLLFLAPALECSSARACRQRTERARL